MNSTFQIEVSSASPVPQPTDPESIVRQCGRYLEDIERDALDATIQDLKNIQQSRDRTAGDKAFGHFTYRVLAPYTKAMMTSRAAWHAHTQVIPAVLELERNQRIEFHKGALFFDTSIAHLVVGDQNRFEYYLAMADEEDYRTHQIEKKAAERGTHNLKTHDLSKPTISENLAFTASLLSGKLVGNQATDRFAIGIEITEPLLEQWRLKLDPFHHAELFRVISEAEVFMGQNTPDYPAVFDNPYLMLRLVKVLSHVSQWAESYLTLLQAGTVQGGSLSPKLANDPDFAPLVTAAGGKEQFAGNSPRTAATADAELQSLLADLPRQVASEEKHWRILRIIYICRNATSHRIDSSLSLYRDRAFLNDLLQVVSIGLFVIHLRKKKAVP